MVNPQALTIKKSEMTDKIKKLDENIVESLSHRDKKSRLSDNSKATYRAVIRDFNRFLAQNNVYVNQESLKGYFNEIKPRYRAATLNLRKCALLKIIKAQLGEDNILLNMAIEKVFEQIDSYRTDKAVAYDECLSETDVQRLIQAAKTEKTKLMIQFLFKTGCRVSEMINVRLSDCRTVNGYIKITLMGKGNKEREVIIPRELYHVIHNTYQGNTWLFESKTAKQLDRHNVKSQIRKVGVSAGYAISPHMLRHARATDMLLNKNISLKAVSRYLGHSSTATTADMYIHDEFDANTLFDKDRI